MKKIVLLSALLAISGALTAQEVQGPDGALKVNVELKDGSPVYSVHYNNKTFLEPSPLGLKKDICTSHIPIILLTAKDSLQDKEEGYQAGADSYLTKPFSATLLHSRINNILESRKRLAERINTSAPRQDLDEKRARLAESMNKLDNEFLEKINQLIEARLSSEKVDIGYLADNMCMSKSTLYRKVKALTGLSTNEYVRKIKMHYAEHLLLEGRYSISEAAFKVGINSMMYFRQCFKEEFGVLPSEYLKQL